MKNLITRILLTASLVLTASCIRQPPRTEPLEPAAPVNATAGNITTPPNEAPPLAPANTTVVPSASPKFELPGTAPVIYEYLQFPMLGEFDKLFIYGNCTVIAQEDTGMRGPISNPLMTWKKGQISPDELKQILVVFQSEQFAGLGNSYNYAANLTPPFATGGGVFTFTVDYGDLHKSVSAYEYTTPDRGETYPGMPPPLNDIYVKLRAVEKALTVIATENITH